MRKQLFYFVVLINISVSAQTGIGTTTPVNKFQVETTAAAPSTSGVGANGNLRLGATGANQVLDLGLGTTYGWLQARDRTNYGTNHNLVINPNGGNVGIGVLSPLDRLLIGSAVSIHDGGHKVIGLGHGIGNGALVTGFPAEIRLDPATGLLSFGTTAASTALGVTPIMTQRMVITSQGNVGIGTLTPTVALQVNGDIIANSIAGSSDARFKTNITPIENPLQKVLKLRGVHFDWNTKAFPERQFSDQKALGFVAQEVEKVVPEVVQTEKTTEGYKAVQYDKIVALLVEAIKEQQKQINRLQKQVTILKKKTN